MPKVLKTAVFILLVVAGIALIQKLKSPVSVVPPSPVAKTAASASEQRPNPVELATLYDNDSSFDSPGCWEVVPRGLQTLGNIPFRIEGLIQLWGKGPAGMGRNYRESASLTRSPNLRSRALI
jgi:hypothetical protein